MCSKTRTLVVKVALVHGIARDSATALPTPIDLAGFGRAAFQQGVAAEDHPRSQPGEGLAQAAVEAQEGVLVEQQLLPQGHHAGGDPKPDAYLLRRKRQ